MKVKAFAKGYYGHRIRKVGDVFDIVKDSHFSDKWMTKFNGKAKRAEPEPEEEYDDAEEPGNEQEVI